MCEERENVPEEERERWMTSGEEKKAVTRSWQVNMAPGSANEMELVLHADLLSQTSIPQKKNTCPATQKLASTEKSSANRGRRQGRWNKHHQERYSTIGCSHWEGLTQLFFHYSHGTEGSLYKTLSSEQLDGRWGDPQDILDPSYPGHKSPPPRLLKAPKNKLPTSAVVSGKV